MKQRRRAQLTSQLTGARSETSLRERPLSVFDPPVARSAADLAETSTGGVRRLDFEEISLDAPSRQEALELSRTNGQEQKTPTKKSIKVTKRYNFRLS